MNELPHVFRLFIIFASLFCLSAPFYDYCAYKIMKNEGWISHWREIYSNNWYFSGKKLPHGQLVRAIFGKEPVQKSPWLEIIKYLFILRTIAFIVAVGCLLIVFAY